MLLTSTCSQPIFKSKIYLITENKTMLFYAVFIRKALTLNYRY